MKSLRGWGHVAPLLLLSLLAIFINGSSKEQPLRHYDDALLPLLKTNHPYLLKGMDLSYQGIGARWLPIRLEGQDLSGLDLRDVRLPSGPGLRRVSLRGAHLARADFSCVNLDEVDFAGADLSQTRFDYRPSNCKNQDRTKAVPPAGCPIALISTPMTAPKPCTRLRIDLTGANLKEALLQGDENSSGQCSHWLVIEGGMAGARFEGATLRCVVLRNQSKTAEPSVFETMGNTALGRQIKPFLQRFQMKDAAPSPQGSYTANNTAESYSGLSFQKSTLENVFLESGNFMFADFWKARLLKAFVSLSRDTNQTGVTSLGYTSMAELDCPENGCKLWFITLPDEKGGSWTTFISKLMPSRLSLNVRNSHIISNLGPQRTFQEPPSPDVLPILLCDHNTKWRVVDYKSANSANSGTGGQAKTESMPRQKCAERNGLMRLQPPP